MSDQIDDLLPVADLLKLLGRDDDTGIEEVANFGPVIYLLTILLSIIGNGTIFVLFLKHRMKYGDRAACYVINIVIIDLLITCIYMPMTVYTGSWVGSDFLCKILDGGRFMLICSSVNVPSALGLSNCQTDVGHLDHRYIPLVWLVSWLSALPAYSVNVLVTFGGGLSCGEQWPHSSALLEVTYEIYTALAHVIIPACVICRVGRHMCRPISESRSNSTRLHHRAVTGKEIHTISTRKSQRDIRLAFVLTCNVIVCRFPMQVWHFLDMFPDGSTFKIEYPYCSFFSNWLAVGFCCSNPFILLAANPVYRRYLYNLWPELRHKFRPTAEYPRERSNIDAHLKV